MLLFHPHQRPLHQPTACLSKTARGVTLALDEGRARQARDGRTRPSDRGGVGSHRAPAAKPWWALRLIACYELKGGEMSPAGMMRGVQ